MIYGIDKCTLAEFGRCTIPGLADVLADSFRIMHSDGTVVK